MRVPLSLFGVIVVLGSSADAQTITACSAQLVPLKPLALMSCSAAAPVCVTDQARRSYRVWGCPTNTHQQPIDPRIPPMYQPPQLDNPGDVALRQEQVRNLQLQNEQLRQQIQQSDNISLPPTAQRQSYTQAV